MQEGNANVKEGTLSYSSKYMISSKKNFAFSFFFLIRNSYFTLLSQLYLYFTQIPLIHNLTTLETIKGGMPIFR